MAPETPGPEEAFIDARNYGTSQTNLTFLK
jgi:hypothetical protein